MNSQFWSDDPTILFNKDHIFEIYPSSSMSYAQTLNAISRLIILLSVLGFVCTSLYRIPIVGILILAIVCVMYKIRRAKLTRPMLENFENNITALSNSNKKKPLTENMTLLDPVTLKTALKSEFKEGSKKNPFSNVLLTEIMDTPDRKSAQPAFNYEVDSDITKNVKRSIQTLNPSIKNTTKQLFGTLWDKFQLDNSLRSFYSMPNSRVENDQSAFAQYLYSDLKYSSHLDTPEGSIARVQDNMRYNLY